MQLFIPILAEMCDTALSSFGYPANAGLVLQITILLNAGVIQLKTEISDTSAFVLFFPFNYCGKTKDRIWRGLFIFL